MKELRGRHVLAIFIAFFATISVVNAVMVYAAITTFGGVDKPNAYKASLAFGRELTEAREQDHRGWKVTGLVDARRSGTVIDISVKDRNDRPLPGLVVSARFGHPVNARMDHSATLIDLGEGHYHGQLSPISGTWDVDIQMSQNGRQVFRSIKRSTFVDQPS